MKTRLMISIDQKIGPVVCAGLRIWDILQRALFFFLRRRKPRGPVRSILVIKCFGMGSIILSTPMLRALKKRHPESKITFLTFSSNKEICRIIPQIDRVIAIHSRTLIGFIFTFIGTLPRMWKEKFDVVIDLEFFARFSSAMSYLSGARRRIGFYLPSIWRGGLLTDPVPLNHTKNVREVFCHLIRPLGIVTHDYTLEFLAAPAEAHAEVKRRLEGKDSRSEKLNIAININSSDLAYERRWPRKYFADLTNRLTQNYNTQIYLIGARQDKKYVEKFSRQLKNTQKITDMTSKLSINQLVALFHSMDLVISNDSGPLQLAIACGVRTISLFGPETPSFYGPIEPGHKTFYQGVFCSPCLNVYSAKMTSCNGDNICMKEIHPNRVYQAAQEMLKEMGWKPLAETPPASEKEPLLEHHIA
jgi:ADP-heptose:LPS heptosyltransferase